MDSGPGKGGYSKRGPQGVPSMPGGSVHTVSGTGDVTGGLALAVQHTVPLDPYRSTSIVPVSYDSNCFSRVP